MKLPDDLRDLLVSLTDVEAEFVVVGGFAHHGHVRATKDIDVLVRASPENASKIIRGLSHLVHPFTPSTSANETSSARAT